MLKNAFPASLAGLVLLFCTAAFAAEPAALRMVSLADSSNPWTVTVWKDGRVEWADSSSGFLFDSPTQSKKGSIPAGQAEALFALARRAGYLHKRPVEGIEPKIKLVLVFADGADGAGGKDIVNSGPSPRVEQEAIDAFAAIEAEFGKAAQAVGVDGLFLFYNQK